MAKNIKRKRRVNLPAVLAIVLFYLTVFSTHLTGGLYAKYLTSDSGSDSARVIKFGQITFDEIVPPDVTDNNWYIIPGVTLEKQAQVSFGGSEADTFLFVEISVKPLGYMVADGTNKNFTLTANGRSIMTWAVADAWTYVYSDVYAGKYVYYIRLDSNQSVTDQDIIKDGILTVSEEALKMDMTSLKSFGEISVSFRSIVVQANGFETPLQAWASAGAI